MTVASPIPIAELATRWYALTVENAPKLDMSLRLEVENYCSGDPWAGNPTSQAMGSILAEDQDLRDQLDRPQPSAAHQLGFVGTKLCK